MSHFTEVKTVFKDQQALVAALETCFGKGNVEVALEGAALFGYHGDDRSKLEASNPNYAPSCNVIVRRAVLGSSSNDIGYRRGADGMFRAYVSDFDRTAQREKLAALNQRYATVAATNAARKQGYTVKEEAAKDGTVRLTLSKWGGE